MVRMTENFRDAVAVEAAPYGLLSPAVNVVRDSDPHWQGGFSHSVSSYVSVANTHGIGDEARVEIFTPSNPKTSREATPFLVEITLRASTIGNTYEDIQYAIRQHLDAATQKAIEREFWAGGIASQSDEEEFPSRYLANEPTVLTTAVGTPPKTKYGLALLERALGDCGLGETGIIHVTRDVGSALGFKGEDGVIKTPMGNSIVAGVGYDGSGPTAPTGDQSWMYATGPVTVRLGPLDFYQKRPSEAINIATNVIEYKAVRSAAVVWTNDCHYGILVDLAQDF